MPNLPAPRFLQGLGLGFGLFLRRQTRSGRPASIGLVVLLVVLPGFSLWTAVATYRCGEAARRATQLSDVLGEARYQVAAEESLERKYRLEPSLEVRRRHHTAAVEMVGALERAQTMAGVHESRMIGDVLVKHSRYLGAIERLFTAVDNDDVERTRAIDEEEVDPAFEVIEERVLTAAVASRIAADERLEELSRLQSHVAVATPIVFAAGLTLVVCFWRVLRSYQAEMKSSVKREAEVALRNEQRYRLLVQNSSDLVLICSAAGIVSYQSPTAATSRGYAAEALRNRSILTVIHPDEEPAARALLEQALAAPGVPRQAELRVRDGAGAWRHADLILTNLLHEPAVAGVVATLHDVDERKGFERQLTQQAFHDSLTGLPNRALLRDRLEQALERAHRSFGSVGVVFLDLDNFKLVNDSLGHHAGDALLLAAAKRLKSSVRKQDTVARLGGDEFVVVLEGLRGLADVVSVVETIIEEFARPFDLEDRNLVVTASIGVALGNAADREVDSLLRDADIAMYRAKTDGKGRFVVFDPSMHADSLTRLELEADLRQALEMHQLRLQYQPIVSLGSGRVTEFEALIRWHHPTRGLIPPLDFIPIAEETGLIEPIGTWVLQEACRQAVAWQRSHDADPPLVMAVNLSPRQFQNPDLVGTIGRILSETGLAAACLKLEITEGVVMRDMEAAVCTLSRLKGLGVQLAIDDFGTGYSSLAYLKRLPLDVLKIDRVFINGLGHSVQDNTIVQAILSLASSLGMSVTAEGIERAEQAAALESWSCDRGQGYFFARPLDAAQAAALLSGSFQGGTLKQIAQAA